MRILLAGVFLALATPQGMAAEVVEAPDFDSGRFSWSGFYMGVSVGHGKAEDDDEAFPIAPGITIELHSEGEDWTKGFHAGYQHQMGSFVVGAEWEYQNIDIQFEGDGIGPIPVYIEDSHTLRLRGGIALDRAHFYVSGGMQYTTTNVDLADWAYTVGAGMEYALTDNVVAGVQYDHSWFEDFDGRPIDGTYNRFSARFGVKF